MDNPSQALRNYMAKCHPQVAMSVIRSAAGERIAKGWGNVTLGSNRWGFHMMIPRSAPENGRPLCTTVKQNGETVWEFEEDHKQYQGVSQKKRVHLYQLSSGSDLYFALVEVLEGDPDMITRVLRVDGDEFRLEIEVLMKVQIGRLWGMGVTLSKKEKYTLDQLMQPKST